MNILKRIANIFSIPDTHDGIYDEKDVWYFMGKRYLPVGVSTPVLEILSTMEEKVRWKYKSNSEQSQVSPYLRVNKVTVSIEDTKTGQVYSTGRILSKLDADRESPFYTVYIFSRPFSILRKVTRNDLPCWLTETEEAFVCDRINELIKATIKRCDVIQSKRDARVVALMKKDMEEERQRMIDLYCGQEK